MSWAGGSLAGTGASGLRAQGAWAAAQQGARPGHLRRSGAPEPPHRAAAAEGEKEEQHGSDGGTQAGQANKSGGEPQATEGVWGAMVDGGRRTP